VIGVRRDSTFEGRVSMSVGKGMWRGSDLEQIFVF
jgi:hypothetical protein